MAFPIDRKFVVGVSSNALFDLHIEDEIFQKQGINAYREHQINNKYKIIDKGLAYPFIERFCRIQLGLP